MSEKEDLLKDLLESVTPAALKDIIKKYNIGSEPTTKAPTKTAAKAPPAKIMTKFIRHFTCATCAARFTVVDELADGESTAYTTVAGRVGVVTGSKNKDKIEIVCWANHCTSCHTRVHMWDRQLLEDRFFQLLKTQERMTIFEQVK